MSETLRTSETLDDVVLFMKISVTSVFEFEGAELTDLYHLKSRKIVFNDPRIQIIVSMCRRHKLILN